MQPATPDHKAVDQIRSSLPLDFIFYLLPFCTPSTLTTIVRVSRTFHDLAIPLLYRHLDLDLALHHPLPLPHSPPNPNLHLTRTLKVRSETHTLGSALSIIPASAVALPNLKALHVQLDRQTCEWPHTCTLVRSLTVPGPPELILSAEKGCDLLYWVLVSRFFESLPRGVKRVVLLMDGSLGNAGEDGDKGALASHANLERLGRSISCVGYGRAIAPPREIVLDYTPRVGGMADGPERREETWDTEVQTSQIAIMALLVLKRPAQLLVKGARRLEMEQHGEQEAGAALPERVEIRLSEIGKRRKLSEEAVENALAGIAYLECQWKV